MEFMKQKWSSGLVLGLFFTALIIGGCTKGDKSTSVSDPSAATFVPVGTIQGKVRDASTLEPITNVIVSIGLAVAVTDAQGQYILANVPATSDALANTINGRYDMTIDLRTAVSPINMNDATASPRYPDFRYENVSVAYTSLNDSSCDDTGGDTDPNSCTSASNHDTPVDHLVANADVNVGKLNSTIQGVVAGCDGTADFFTPVAGATVNLVNDDFDNQNSGSGQPGNVVGTTTTDAAGVFTFSNIEASRDFDIVATLGTPPTMDDSVNVTSPSDGQTLYLQVQESTALHLCPIDNHGPTIIAVSPEPGSDLTAGATDVVFTFSEAVEQTPETSTDPSNQAGLLNSGKLEVEFDGTKSEVLFTAAWNATFDQLTIALTNVTGSSSLYEARLNLTGMTDAAGQGADNGICPVDAPGPWAGIGGGAGDCVVYFSTNGGATPGTPVLTLDNAASLDEVGTTTGIFDWPTVTGAKTYNFYCRTNQVYFDGTVQLGAWERTASNLIASSNNEAFGTFVGTGNQHALQYDCFVRGVNSDSQEGLDSNIKTAKDVLGPRVSPGSVTVHDHDGDGNADEVHVAFNENLDETTAEVAGNYTFTVNAGTAPIVSAAALSSGTNVALTISQTQTPAALQDNAGDTLVVNTNASTGVKDVSLNATRSAADTYNLLTGVVN